MKRLLLLIGVAALLALSTASASSLGSSTDASLTQSIRHDVDPCGHAPTEPDPCPEGFVPYVPAECDGSLADYRVIVGTDENDDLTLNSANPDHRPSTGRDLVFGLGGDDRISGGEAEDCLVGGDGSDTLNGDKDDDVLRGGPGDDVLDGGDGTDTCEGGPGNNTLADCE